MPSDAAARIPIPLATTSCTAAFRPVNVWTNSTRMPAMKTHKPTNAIRPSQSRPNVWSGRIRCQSNKIETVNPPNNGAWAKSLTASVTRPRSGIGVSRAAAAKTKPTSASHAIDWLDFVDGDLSGFSGLGRGSFNDEVKASPIDADSAARRSAVASS